MPYIEGESHQEDPQQTQDILRRRKGVHQYMPPTMSIGNISTHVLPSEEGKEM